MAETFAQSLDVPFDRTKILVASGGNLQARARAARWIALRAAAARVGADRIATGHHADDRAETLLMRLLRGTGVRGLAVLPPCDGDRIRPILRARRSDVDAHLARHRIPHCSDPSNADPRFLRARVRHEVFPVLQRLNPRFVEHMCALADRIAETSRTADLGVGSGPTPTNLGVGSGPTPTNLGVGSGPTPTNLGRNRQDAGEAK